MTRRRRPEAPLLGLAMFCFAGLLSAGPVDDYCLTPADYCLDGDSFQASDSTTAGEFSPAVECFLKDLHELDPDGEICIPGLGTEAFPADHISALDYTVERTGYTLAANFPLFQLGNEESEIEELQQLYESELIQVLHKWPAEVPVIDEERDYNIVITSVDTTRFPIVNVQMKVFLKGMSTDFFGENKGLPFEVTETLLQTGETQPVTEFPPGPGFAPGEEKFVGGADGCLPDTPVLMGVAIDTSGSMANVVKTSVLPAAQDYVDWVMGQGSGELIPGVASPMSGQDRVSFYTFSGDGNFRAPKEGEYTGAQVFAAAGGGGNTDPPGFQEEYDALKTSDAGGMSPILQGMNSELGRLLEYQADCNVFKFLVTMSDFCENASSQASKDELAGRATSNQVMLANLLMGTQETIDYCNGDELADEWASDGKGVVVKNAMSKAWKAFYSLHMGATRTYCLRYRSRFPDKFNGVVNVALNLPATGGADQSQATARYALPFLVPEDTADPEVFFPVSDYLWARFGSLGSNLGATATVSLFNKPDNTEEHPGHGLNRPPVVEDPQTFELQDLSDFLQEVEIEGPGVPPDTTIRGFWLRDRHFQGSPDDPDMLWNALFRTPTSALEISEDPDAPPPLEKGTHVRVSVALKNLDNTVGSCANLGGTPILGVEDRTPPSVYLELRPSSGEDPSWVHVLPQGIDQDPWPIAGVPYAPGVMMLPIMQTVLEDEGFGAKRARIRYQWLDPEGEVVPGSVIEDQLWSDGGEPPAQAIPADPEVQDPDQQPHPIFNDQGGGFAANAGVRVELTIKARDNYAMLEGEAVESPLPAFASDIWAFAPDPGGEEDFVPPDAEFRSLRSHATIQTVNPKPPWFPLVPWAELETGQTLPGISWRIDSQVDADVYDLEEGIDHYQFNKADTDELSLEDMDSLESPSLRHLEVLARDAHGNSTRFRIRLETRPEHFRSKAIREAGRRHGG